MTATERDPFVSPAAGDVLKCRGTVRRVVEVSDGMVWFRDGAKVCDQPLSKWPMWSNGQSEREVLDAGAAVEPIEDALKAKLLDFRKFIAEEMAAGRL